MTRSLLLISITILTLFFSCKSSEPTIITVGSQSINKNEFKYIYEKNHAKDHDRYSKESLDQYLELFVNYRLKVLEAENLKLDSTPAFQTEYNGYKKQLAKPYFADDLMTNKLAKEAYNRSKTAIKARHILITVDETASPQDTLYAFNRIKRIKDTITKGADFGTMAYQFSQDPSAKGPKGKPGHKGDLGYFSSLRMVYGFENAAFNTPTGQVSTIVRTKFGYHILEVEDVVPMDYKAKVSHIMIKAPNGISDEDSLERKAQADAVYQKLQTGQDWDSLCAVYSAHDKTKNNGGLLPAFTLGGSMGLPSFELASYKLDTIGDISEPIKTPYGWHVIKLMEKVPFNNYEEEKEEYIAKVKKDARSQQNQTALANQLKKENDFKENKDRNATINLLTTQQLVEKQWNIENHTNLLQKELFSINTVSYTVYDFGQYIEQNQKTTKKGSKEYMMESLYSSYVTSSLIIYEEDQLASKYFDYKMLIQEFHDGILIYDLMKMRVWDKANSDTAGLNNYYKNNTSNYLAPDEITGTIYTVYDLSKMADIKNDITNHLTPEAITNKYNTDTTTLVTMQSGTFERGQNYIFDTAQWDMKKPIEMYLVEGTDYIISKTTVNVNENYDLAEIRGRVVADYQKELEKNFIIELKTKYQVKVIEKEYNSLIKY